MKENFGKRLTSFEKIENKDIDENGSNARYFTNLLKLVLMLLKNFFENFSNCIKFLICRQMGVLEIMF